jgi:chromate reductase, NAD(P)H dehydrogenase (quinone)
MTEVIVHRKDNNMADGTDGNAGREEIRFLVFSASLRTGSLNTHLARIAARTIEQHGGIADLASMEDFDCPSFDQDVQDADGLPQGAQRLHDRLVANDGFVIASPEYNASMPGVLKNAIDWVSRFRPQPFNERHGLLLSASPSMAGGNRGLWSLRIPLEHLGARIFPDMYSLATAHKAFTPEGTIADPALARRFESTVLAFIDLAEAARHYPCVKKEWVEFLGEHPDPVIDRVE